MSHIVGFVGLAGSGKTYEANKLVARGYRKISFADGLRDILFELTGVPEDYDEFKKSYVIHSPLTGRLLTGRQALQHLGSAIRKNNPNYFLEVLCSKVQACIINEDDVVIDDIRYPNELELVKELIKESKYGYIRFCNFTKNNPSFHDKHESNQLALHYVKKNLSHLDNLYSIDLYGSIFAPKIPEVNGYGTIQDA